MAEFRIEEAAAAYGVAPETIWRAVQDGQLAARVDWQGRYLVMVPPPAVGPPAVVPQTYAGQALPSYGVQGYGYEQPGAIMAGQADSLRQELEYTRYLLSEVSHQRDQLEVQVQAQLRQLERSEEAQHELRVLIGSAMRPGDGAMRQVASPAVAQQMDAPKRRWWPF